MKSKLSTVLMILPCLMFLFPFSSYALTITPTTLMADEVSQTLVAPVGAFSNTSAGNECVIWNADNPTDANSYGIYHCAPEGADHYLAGPEESMFVNSWDFWGGEQPVSPLHIKVAEFSLPNADCTEVGEQNNPETIETSVANCVASAVNVVDVTYNPYSSGSIDVTLPSIISDAESTFSGSTGFTWTEVVNWTGTNIKLVLGSGIGMLTYLLPYIVALVIISIIVIFMFTAFRFFRH